MPKFNISTIALLSALTCTSAFAGYTFYPQNLSISKSEWTTETDNPKFFINRYGSRGGFGTPTPPPALNLANCTFSNSNVLKFSTETPPTADTGLVIIDAAEARKLPRGANNLTISCDTFIKGARNYVEGGFNLEPAKLTAAFTIHNTYPDLTRAVARIDDSNRSVIKLSITRPQADVTTSRGVNYWIAAIVPGRIFGVAEDQLFFLTPNASGGTQWQQLTSGDALSVAYLKNQNAASNADEIPVNFGFSKEEMASIGATVFFAYQIDGKDITVLDYAWNPAIDTPVASNYATPQKLYSYEALNKVRKIIGLNYVKQSENMDRMAQSHADYLAINGEFGHLETAGKPGFTGVTPYDRAQKFGFPMGAGEVVANNRLPQDRYYDIWVLLGVPYHAQGLLRNYTELGIGKNQSFVVNMKYDPYLPKNIDTTAVVVFPCNNVQVDVTNQGYEIPNPSVLNGKDDFGYSSLAMVRQGQKLVIDSWELRDKNNNLINTAVMVNETDNTGFFTDDVAALIPINPLPLIATSYTSVLRGKNNGVPFEKTCTWRTVGEGEIAAN